jgi:hypothetical protein
MFSPYRVGIGNDDISSEEQFKNSKISRGSYIYLELFIIVLWEFYPVTLFL